MHFFCTLTFTGFRTLYLTAEEHVCAFKHMVRSISNELTFIDGFVRSTGELNSGASYSHENHASLKMKLCVCGSAIVQ